MIEAQIVTKILDYLPDDRAGKPQLAFADLIVAGGRGMKRPENFQLIWDLAAVLGAEVGASRPVVQAGWVDLERQIGQSGKTVRPKLYIAAGISGAVQHRVGMEGADVIARQHRRKRPDLRFCHLRHRRQRHDDPPGTDRGLSSSPAPRIIGSLARQENFDEREI